MRVRIRQLEERVATQGLHFGLGPLARKLEPGEVVEIPEGDLFDQLWDTGKLELTRDPVTRPLEYENEREAKLCSPTFTPRGPDEEIMQQKALDKVAGDLEQLEVASETETVDDSPATEPQHANPVPPELPPETPGNRRAARRRASRGTEVST